jgi:hypothetical protein
MCKWQPASVFGDGEQALEEDVGRKVWYTGGVLNSGFSNHSLAKLDMLGQWYGVSVSSISTDCSGSSLSLSARLNKLV